MASSFHKDSDEFNKHTAKGFDNGITGSYPIKDENNTQTFTPLTTLPNALDFKDGNAAPPVSPTTGDVYVIVDEGNGAIHVDWTVGPAAAYNDWVRWSGFFWVPITPQEGAVCYDETAQIHKKFNGTTWEDLSTNLVTSVNGQTGAVTVQDTLVSGTNIKSVNSQTLLGSGNLDLRGDFKATGTYNAKNEIQNKPILFPALDFRDGNAAPPVAFTDDIYVLIDLGNGAIDVGWGANYGDWVINNGSTWVAHAPTNGTLCHNKTTDTLWQYIDGAWVEKLSNATHTGEVTGATALTVNVTAITNKTAASTPLAGTELALIEQSGTLKKVAVSNFGGSVMIAGAAPNSTIRCGVSNVSDGNNSAALSGGGNSACGIYSIVAGGRNNSIPVASNYGTVSGGYLNTMTSNFGVIGGGLSNSVGYISTVGGGWANTASANYGFVGGGYSNAASYIATIGGGYDNTASGNYSAILGGHCNNATAAMSSIGGGTRNTASGACSTVSGGKLNTSSACWSTVSGGYNNTSSGAYSGILGGVSNSTNGQPKTFIVGSNITADRTCATFVNNLSIMNVPTSSAGLPAGSVWSNSGVLTIV